MKSILKNCRLIKILVLCVMIFSLAMTSIDVFAAYSSDWKSWTQSGSSNSNVKEYGCRVVAFAKIIYESGWADFSSPDEYFNICVQKGWFQSGVAENGSFGDALSSYISSRGGTCSKIREISLNQNATSYSDDIMNYVRSGYYITLSLGGSQQHTAYISPSASVAAGKPVVYDSGKSTSTSLIHDLSNKANTGGYWTKLRVWQISAGGTSGSSDTMMPSIQNVKVVERYKNGFKMQCFVSDNVGVAKVQFPTWETSKTSEGCTWYDGTHIGNGVWEFTFPSGTTEGWYTTHIYAWDTSGNYASKGVDTYVDQTQPTIENIEIVDRYSNGFKMRCLVRDNAEISRVEFPTWESTKTSEGCNWYGGTHIGNGIWEFDFKDASVEGCYTTHVYAWDTTGNNTCVGTETYVDQTPPTVTDISIVDITADGYKVRCKVVDNYAIDRVQFPSWTAYNLQDDIVVEWWTNPLATGVDCGNGIYEFYVKRTDHNEEFGEYTTHIYAYDKNGNRGFGDAGLINLENVVPTFTAISISNQTKEGYTVTCGATDESGIGKIDVCVWTTANGQDDIVVGNGSYIGEDLYSYNVKYSDHNDEYGEYITHVYAYDTLGNSVFCGEIKVENKESESENPGGSTDPSNPVNPSDPTDPSNPSDPTDPSKPEEPAGPTSPSVPSDSDTPSATTKICEHNYVFLKGSYFEGDVSLPDWRQYKCRKCSDIKTEYYRIEGISAGEVVTIGDLQYVITSTATYHATAKLEKVTNKNITTLNVPNEIEYKSNKFKVTEMSEGLCANYKKLKKVIIGDNVKAIPKKAFYKCKKLKEVYMGFYVKKVQTQAFYGCTALKKVNLGLYTESVEKKAFYGCTKLNEIYFYGTKTIGESAFMGCKKLQAISLSDVKTIGKKAFYNCKNIGDVTITSDKLKSVGNKAFGNIKNKADIYLIKSKFKKYKKVFKGKCPSGVTYHKF